jgi:hypothetical protein
VFKFEEKISLIITDGYLTKRQLEIYVGLFESARIVRGELVFKIEKEAYLSQLFEAKLTNDVVRGNSIT